MMSGRQHTSAIVKSTVVILLCVVSVIGQLKVIKLPTGYVECRDNYNGSNAETQEEIESNCVMEYKWQSSKGKEKYKGIKEYIDGIIKRLLLPTRKPPRVRKEYRMLTDKERHDFHSAIKALKKDKSMYPNKYDAIASFHNEKDAKYAHFGPNLLSWHRLYQVVFEEALREHYPDTAVPYWDCTIDAPLQDHTDTVILSKEFLGNGDGTVVEGPFAEFAYNGTQLIRNCGKLGENLFMTKEYLKDMLTYTHTSEIMSSLENQHNRFHRFLGGHMIELSAATHDPTFFLLHSFIDYVWYKFQINQEKKGIDPSKDYPDISQWPKVTKGHHKDTKIGFGDLKNIDGFSIRWVKDVYTYEESPTCSRAKPSCGSKWLYCDLEQEQCVSKTRSGTGLSRRGAKKTNISDNYLKRDTETAERHVIDIDKDENPSCGTFKTAFQNTFMINGKADTSQWSYLPVKILYQRTKNERFGSYPILNGKVMQDRDVYDTNDQIQFFPPYRDGQMVNNRNCEKLGSGVTKVWVQSEGMNYAGSAAEYALIDERMKYSSTYVYIPVKSPKESSTEVYLRASDSCGNMCRALCRESNTTYFVECDGAVEIEHGDTEVCSATYADAVYKIWKQDRIHGVPYEDKNNEHVIFHCDF